MRYISLKTTWENGTSVNGVAIQKNSYGLSGFNNVELIYEVDGKEVRTKALFDNKEIKAMEGVKGQKKEEVEIHYPEENPEKGVAEQQMLVIRNAVLLGVVLIPIVWVVLQVYIKSRKA